jgi:hypothetical protein
MPYEMKFKFIPAGFPASTIPAQGYGWICVKEFVSSEDGLVFVERLEGMAQMLFPAISPSISILAANVNHYLAIIRPDSTGAIYINELNFQSRSLPKRPVNAGQPLSFDDLADVKEMRIYLQDQRIVVPGDCGIALFFGVGWRRGLFYDFSPLAMPPASGVPRDYDIETLLGQYYTYLGFQGRLQIADADWKQMLQQRWFPFISLKMRTIQEILSHVRNGLAVDDLLPKIHQEVLAGLDGELGKWQENLVFKDHMEFLRRAAERYKEGDYISAVSILFPKIEGILRGFHGAPRSRGRIGQSALIQAAIDNNPNVQHEHCLLLPARFREYLSEVFFEDFDPKNPENLTRHTVAHGVAPVTDFNLKGITLGFLILQQLSYYLISPDVLQP